MNGNGNENMSWRVKWWEDLIQQLMEKKVIY